MNQINIINPYTWNSWWVFDDEDKGLIKEPLVAGADTLLTKLAGPVENVTIAFSQDAFPGHTHMMEKVGEGMGGGTDYIVEMHGYAHELWLCPALLKYFDEAPESIYFNLKAIPKPDPYDEI